MAPPKGNKYAVGIGIGRPAKFNSADELRDKCLEYFQECDGVQELDALGSPIFDKMGQPVWVKKPESLTISGLCLFLGFSTTQNMYTYLRRGDDIGEVMQWAWTTVMYGYEKMLPDGKASRGAQYAMGAMGFLKGAAGDTAENSQATNDAPSPFDGYTFEQLYKLKYGVPYQREADE